MRTVKTLIRLGGRPGWSAQSDLSLHWPQSHFVGFVRSQLICTVDVSVYFETYYIFCVWFWSFQLDSDFHNTVFPLDLTCHLYMLCIYIDYFVGQKATWVLRGGNILKNKLKDTKYSILLTDCTFRWKCHAHVLWQVFWNLELWIIPMPKILVLTFFERSMAFACNSIKTILGVERQERVERIVYWCKNPPIVQPIFFTIENTNCKRIWAVWKFGLCNCR